MNNYINDKKHEKGRAALKQGAIHIVYLFYFLFFCIEAFRSCLLVLCQLILS